MTCEECQEQVLELIEREVVDPDGVREILERCPDCREAFDALKVTMALAAQMPIEQPAAGLDAAVLRAAAARAPQAVRTKRAWHAPPWAMAAIAMLAVGVGVWAIPRRVEREGDVPAPVRSVEDEATVAEQLGAEPATPEEKEATSPEPIAKKRRRQTGAREPKGEPARKAMAPQPTADVAARGLAAPSSSEAQVGAMDEAFEARDEAETAACRRRIEETERRARAGLREPSNPEELLAIGRCYQVLGNGAEARKWFSRAATHRETAKRAREALVELDSE